MEGKGPRLRRPLGSRHSWTAAGGEGGSWGVIIGHERGPLSTPVPWSQPRSCWRLTCVRASLTQGGDSPQGCSTTSVTSAWWLGPGRCLRARGTHHCRYLSRTRLPAGPEVPGAALAWGEWGGGSLKCHRESWGEGFWRRSVRGKFCLGESGLGSAAKVCLVVSRS